MSAAAPSILYPAELEQRWLEIARAETRATTDRDALRRLLPDIQRLADRFTTARPGGGEGAYLKDTRTCAAYSLYFAPQTHARTTHLLREWPPLADSSRPLRVLDLGAGTGAASWAVLDHLGPRPVTLIAVDHSRPALRCLHERFSEWRRARWPQAILRTVHSPLADYVHREEPCDVVLIHYVLNELLPDARRALLARAARALSPAGRLLVCEPLVQDAGDYMRELRDHARGDLGLNILSPCPHSHACPLGEPCHAVRTWTVPRALQILNTSLHRDLRHLVYAHLMLSPAPLPDNGIVVRVVGSPSHGKGQTLFTGCCPDGCIHRIQLLHREFDTHGRKALRHLERGQRLSLSDLYPLGDPSLYRATPHASPFAGV